MKYIWLESDLEPDDILAIFILIMRGYIPKYIVVGESDSRIKKARMVEYINILKSDKLLPFELECKIIKGNSSDKFFENDGNEFDNLKLDVVDDICDYSKNLRNYVNEVENPTIVCLKPCRELLENSCKISDILNKISIYFYGSFNFRALKSKSAELIELMSKFKLCYVYESHYASGRNNSLNITTMPKTTELLINSKYRYINILKNLVYLWNNHITNSSLSKLRNILSKYNINSDLTVETILDVDIENILRDSKMNSDDIDSFNRSYKICKSKIENNNFELVLADIGLAVMLEIDKYAVSGKISLDGYTQFVEDSNSNIYIYRNVDINWDTIISEYLK
jgi:hypothetical protein